jgi:hypothetical protein
MAGAVFLEDGSSMIFPKVAFGADDRDSISDLT